MFLLWSDDAVPHLWSPSILHVSNLLAIVTANGGAAVPLSVEFEAGFPQSRSESLLPVLNNLTPCPLPRLHQIVSRHDPSIKTLITRHRGQQSLGERAGLCRSWLLERCPGPTPFCHLLLPHHPFIRPDHRTHQPVYAWAWPLSFLSAPFDAGLASLGWEGE